jgi:hypothetical protein
MKSLVLFSYRQPVEGSKFRWGVLAGQRDTKKQPLAESTLSGPYRWDDIAFDRSRTLDTVLTTKGPKAFYHERQRWSVRVPFVGSLVAKFLPQA